jgi:succinate dehydrogenase/fumarate reductase flavoprotein subunit
MIREIQEGRGTANGGVYYDLQNMRPETALSYSQIRRVLKALGQTPAEARIEVAPTQHYVMGGVRTDESAATDVPGLFAVGEVAGGTHGAHRLATCGGTEVIAMGAIAGESAARYAHGRVPNAGGGAVQPRPELLPETLEAADPARLHDIRTALEETCGVLREHGRLHRTLAALDTILEQVYREGRAKTFVGRSLLVASTVALSAHRRTESRGDHFRTDFPFRDDRRWLGNLVATLAQDHASIALAFEPAGISTRTPGPSR